MHMVELPFKKKNVDLKCILCENKCLSSPFGSWEKDSFHALEKIRDATGGVLFSLMYYDVCMMPLYQLIWSEAFISIV